jgi:hypothetical protein
MQSITECAQQMTEIITLLMVLHSRQYSGIECRRRSGEGGEHGKGFRGGGEVETCAPQRRGREEY